MPTKPKPPPLAPLKPPGKKQKPVYTGADGIKYTSQIAAANSFTRKALSQSEASKAAVSAYNDLLSQWGINATAKQRKLIQGFIARQALKAGANESPRSAEFQRLFIKKFPGLWSKSDVGSARLAEARTALKTVFGSDWKSQLENKGLKTILNKYSRSVSGLSAQQLENLIRGSRGFKEAKKPGGEFQYLNELLKGQEKLAGESLASQVATLRQYEDTLNDKLSAAGLNPASDAQVFFRSGISLEDFSANVGTYLSNRDAFMNVMNRDMTAGERQYAFYDVAASRGGVVGEGQGYGQWNRTALERAGKFGAAFTDTVTQAYQNVLGHGVSQTERQQALYGAAGEAERTVGAVQRATTVGETLGQQAGAYQWQRGQAVNQGQKESLVYNTAQAANIYDAHKSAFSLNKAYNRGSAGSFGLARNQSGQIVTQGV